MKPAPRVRYVEKPEPKETWLLDEEGEARNEPTSAHYGAHDLAPHQDPKKPPFFLWKKRFKLPADGLMLADDLSNLDEVVEEILRRVNHRQEMSDVPKQLS